MSAEQKAVKEHASYSNFSVRELLECCDDMKAILGSAEVNLRWVLRNHDLTDASKAALQDIHGELEVALKTMRSMSAGK